VAFHCADIAPDDLTAALFGSVEESATSTRSGVASAPFDRARTGTLFLDDLLLVPPAARLRLADALATTATKGGKASAPKPRIVSAADVPPERLVAKGFDPVLARVLTGVTLEVKPLRERPEDILALAQQALKREAGPATELSVLDPKVTAMLTRYNWPGNTAELEKFVIQAWRKATTK
jgi:DNA-binding NtrC family response regulator